MRTLHLTPLCMQDFSFLLGTWKVPKVLPPAAAQFNFTQERFFKLELLPRGLLFLLSRGEISKCASLPGIPPHPPLRSTEAYFFPQKRKRRKKFFLTPRLESILRPLPLPSLFLASKKKGCSRERNGAS